MTVESVTYITDLNPINPAGTDQKKEGDNHIRNIKTGLENTFSGFTGAAMTATEAELNLLTGTTVSFSSITAISGSSTKLDAIDNGTLIAFQQSAAPTGWTKQITHNDKALRVVSGTASSGGTNAYSTVFAKTATDSHTLVVSEIPSHTHNVKVIDGTTGSSLEVGRATTASSTQTLSAKALATGGGGGHTHPITNFDLQYVDLIIASKDA